MGDRWFLYNDERVDGIEYIRAIRSAKMLLLYNKDAC
jgi:hypothetical protein